jgi:hypothetical protein
MYINKSLHFNLFTNYQQPSIENNKLMMVLGYEIYSPLENIFELSEMKLY